MFDFCIDMMKVSCKQINQAIEVFDRQNQSHVQTKRQSGTEIISNINQTSNRSKSNNETSQNVNGQKPSFNNTESEKEEATQIRCDYFCSGQADMIKLMNYFDSQMQVAPKSFIAKSKNESQVGSEQAISFAKVFSLDQKSQTNMIQFAKSLSQEIDPLMHYKFLKFTYNVVNDKILSKHMFYVDVQREKFINTLRDIKELVSSFIQRKYKNCITKIGFGSQQELYNIFNKMFVNKSGFFNNKVVRKVLHCFWMSIRDIFFKIRLTQFDQSRNLQPRIKFINKLTLTEETMLKNNFYIRLELFSRGRDIFESQSYENLIYQMHCLIPDFQMNTNDFHQASSTSIGHLDLYTILYPMHKAVFDSNLRLLSKHLKQEVDGVFFSNINCLDSCGNTPLLLAVKLGNIDAVKILTDMYSDPKLRSLPELMNAKEVAIAMKNQPILKILITANQQQKLEFFEETKQTIFKVIESIPDFKVDLALTCDSNFFPMFSSVAPSDTYKIYKQGSNLRLDMTLLGLQGFNLLKGNISVLYKGQGSDNEEFQAGELLFIDNKTETVQNVFSRNQENKINTEINTILTGKQILKKYQALQSSLALEMDRQNKPIIKAINSFECQKWQLKSKYNMIKYQMNLNQIDKIKGLNSFHDYTFSLELDYVSLLQIQLDSYYTELESTQSLINLNTFFAEKNKLQNAEQRKHQFPGMGLNTSRANLAGTSKLSSRENSILRNYAGEAYNNQQVHTQEDQLNNTNEKITGVFKYKKQSNANQNIMLASNKTIIIKKNAPKQIQASLWLCKTYPFDIEQFLPLFHVLSFCSKQIRQFNKFLLKYPLPKNSFPVEARIPLFMTMEAVFSFKNLELGKMDPTIFQIDNKVFQKQKANMAIYAKQQISYLHLHSLDTQEDKQAKALREIYKLCKTDEGDSGDNYNNDDYPLYRHLGDKNAKRNEDNDSENSDKIKEMFEKMEDHTYDINNDLVMIQEEAEGEDNLIQSRNLTKINKGFQDLKNSLSHSQMKKLRTQQANGGMPSMQFSMYSDITESVEVSERDDKLAKLQIHSFQNVKFMSQLKKNKRQSQIQSNQINVVMNQQGPNDYQPILINSSNQTLKSNRNKQRNYNTQLGHFKNQLSGISQQSGNLENIHEINENRFSVNTPIGTKNNALMNYNSNQGPDDDEGLMFGRPKIGQLKYQMTRQLKLPAQDAGQSYLTIGTMNDSVIQDSKRVKQPIPKKEVFINQPNNNIGQSFVSMGITNNDGNSQYFQSQSDFSAGLHTKHDSRGGAHSTTNDSSKMKSQASSFYQKPMTSKQARVLENLRLKVLRNQGTQNYLNTIESEGNLPTQQFGASSKHEKADKVGIDNLSQRSIHSLDEAEGENSQIFQQDSSVVQQTKQKATSESQSQQIFSYEKQKLRGTIKESPTYEEQQPAQGIKLNFFQKLGNFIQESIKDDTPYDNFKQITMKKVKRQVATPQEYQMVSPMQQTYNKTTDRDFNFIRKTNEIFDNPQAQAGINSQIEISNNAIKLKQAINQQLQAKKSDKSLILVAKNVRLTDPPQNTTQTENSHQRLVTPSILMERQMLDQSPQQEGQIQSTFNQIKGVQAPMRRH